MEQVRYGIIGVGNMGTTHAEYLFAGEIKGAVLAAICDLVVFPSCAGILVTPVGSYKSALFKSLEGGIERRLFQFKFALAYVSDMLIDIIPVIIFFHKKREYYRIGMSSYYIRS